MLDFAIEYLNFDNGIDSSCIRVPLACRGAGDPEIRILVVSRWALPPTKARWELSSLYFEATLVHLALKTSLQQRPLQESVIPDIIPAKENTSHFKRHKIHP